MTQRTEADGPGHAAPLGATHDGDGVNFRGLFRPCRRGSRSAFFPRTADRDRAASILTERDGDLARLRIRGCGRGSFTVLRAWGPYAPMQGHRFNPNKLLIDPYARRLTGHPVWTTR
jgi:isoamylase